MRFPVLALLAVMMVGLNWLAPSLQRNVDLESHIFIQQQELIALQLNNQHRRLIIEKMKADPEISARLFSAEVKTNERIALPESLMMQWEAKIPEKSFSADSVSPTWQQRWQATIAVNSAIRKILYASAGLLLLLGLLPWQKEFYSRQRFRVQKLFMRAFHRYQIDAPHSNLAAPHWDSTPRAAELNRVENQSNPLADK